MSKKIYIGCGAGFAGDRFDASIPIVKQLANVNAPKYLIFEVLAERTLALAQQLRNKNSEEGYSPFLDSYINPILEDCLENNIKIDKVLSSEWCRCKQTAQYAFNKYETKSFLNSFFSEKFASNKNKQINDLKKYINEWSGDNNLVLVTHYVTIQEVLNVTSSSGELIIADRNFNVLARQNF